MPIHHSIGRLAYQRLAYFLLVCARRPASPRQFLATAGAAWIAARGWILQNPCAKKSSV